MTSHLWKKVYVRTQNIHVFVFNNMNYVLLQQGGSMCNGGCARAGGLSSNIESIAS